MICRALGKCLPPILIIITYHTVKPSQTARFEKQMKTLLKIGRPVSLGDNNAILKSEYNIAITFDDAYQSVVQNALPILQKNNIPSTIFVPTGCLGNKPAWITKSSNSFANEIVLSESQLKTLPADLITIGSHTVSHTELINVDETTFKREINNSKNKLEAILANRPITLISVPYGQFDKKFTRLFKAVGYERVFLNIPTFPANKTDLFVMGRIGVDPEEWMVEFHLKLLGAYQWLPFAINIKKKCIG